MNAGGGGEYSLVAVWTLFFYGSCELHGGGNWLPALRRHALMDLARVQCPQPFIFICIFSVPHTSVLVRRCEPVFGFMVSGYQLSRYHACSVAACLSRSMVSGFGGGATPPGVKLRHSHACQSDDSPCGYPPFFCSA